MIKRFIKNLLKTPSGPGLGKRVEIPLSKHQIDVGQIDKRALDVVQTLRDAGYEAYIVGGAVRDLLLGLRPKDFDIATNATPEEVKPLFRRSFIIGRRFRIVHVVFGRGRGSDVIEVSTFRAYFDPTAAQTVHGNKQSLKNILADKSLAVDDSGRVLRDNVWGDQQDDAARRDFTINAMYYDPIKQVVVDYHHGFKDAQKRILRIIGEAPLRYREDPVRILRVVRFSAKLASLGFKIDDATREPIRQSISLLKNIPPSRMFDEMIKLLQTGHAQQSIYALRDQGLLGVFPMLDGLIKDEVKHPLAWLALEDTDERVALGKSVVPSFMLATLLWPEVQKYWHKHINEGVHQVPALQDAIDKVFNQHVGDVSGRGKLGADMREIWLMQPRFDKRTGKTPFGFINQPRFRAAFDFMRLRAEIGDFDPAVAHWWDVFSSGDEPIRQELIQQARAEKKRPDVPGSAKGTEDGSVKRRRRRRPARKKTELQHPDDTASISS